MHRDRFWKCLVLISQWCVTCLCTAACVVELPVFHYMGPVLRFVGVQDMLHWAMFFFLVRLGCYTVLGFLPSPWMVIPTTDRQILT